MKKNDNVSLKCTRFCVVITWIIDGNICETLDDEDTLSFAIA